MASKDEQLLTVDDLASRWGLTPLQVRMLVKRDGLPYISFQPFTPGRMHISWRFIRFDHKAVAEWEDGRRMAFAAPEPPRPKTVALRKMGAI